ncbi:MAG: TIGR00159 family protein [Ardenticatenaceae bacterium]|nr:TIGR00159 family protein [Ardenticatenaceae bacterium]MCB9445501.1 TIGR00159 family protein [Ardenticatenaceae bacterium]
MESLELLFADTVFRLSNLDLLGIIDLVLVALVVFLLLVVVGRSQAGVFLRGVLVLVLLLLVITILLPLPTFDWLVRAALLVMLVATPVILQPELRRVLERVGRTTGLGRAVRQTTAETVLPRLLRSVESLSAGRTGALIVLEGNESIQQVIDTGVPLDGQLSQELLQTIFFDKTPLHDGAVILRGDQIVAASCVLPLTEQHLHSYRRLGTRHRSAVGMSERSDALVVVVSEETGHVSAAYGGHLYQRLDSTALRQKLYDFYTGELTAVPSPTIWSIMQKSAGFVRNLIVRPNLHQLGRGVLVLVLTAVLTLAAWSYVVEQTNPTARPEINGIPLRIEGIPAGMAVVGTPPSTVSAVVQTTAEQQEGLDANSFQAVVSLADLSAGLQKLPVTVNSAVSPLEIIAIQPASINIELAAIISQTMHVSVNVTDEETVSVAYEVSSRPIASPGEVTIVGPEPLVAQVSKVQADLSVLNATTTIRTSRPLQALDENGSVVSGVTLIPAQVQISLIIAGRSDARDVGIRAITEGAPPEGYWMTSLTTSPSGVTLQGDPLLLADVNGYVDTLPVDVSQAVGPLTIQTPLNLPQGITAVDSAGNPVQAVTVTANIEARSGDLLLTRPVNVVGMREGVTVTVTPDKVDLLLSGPLPSLREIEANPELVQIVLDVARLIPIEGQSYEETPQVTAPEDVKVQLTPLTVLVTMTRQADE